MFSLVPHYHSPPSIFSQHVSFLLVVYLDDILIFSPDEMTHVKFFSASSTTSSSSRLRNANSKPKPSFSCVLLSLQISFKLFLQKSVRLLSGLQVSSALSGVHFNRCFIGNVSTVAALKHGLGSSKIKFLWSQQVDLISLRLRQNFTYPSSTSLIPFSSALWRMRPQTWASRMSLLSGP